MTTNVNELLGLLAQTNQLKRIPRMGWLLRGVGPADTESVAEHTFGMAFTALLLAEYVEQPVDRGRLLTVCLLHDLPEAEILDLVPAAVRYLTPASKRRAEEAALSDLLAAVPAGDEFGALWKEFEDGTSTEGRLARDADKLEMLLQAAAYEQAGWRGMEEFWETMSHHSWEFPISDQLFRALAAQRDAQGQGLAESPRPNGERA
jgi:putative hydrolase of HD superfamily